MAIVMNRALKLTPGFLLASLARRVHASHAPARRPAPAAHALALDGRLRPPRQLVLAPGRRLHLGRV